MFFGNSVCRSISAVRGRAYYTAFLVILATRIASLPLTAVTPAGTVLSNQATLQSATGSVASNTIRLTVGQVAGVTLSTSSGSLTGVSGNTLCFPVALTNTGNGSDSFSLSASSSAGWPVTLCYDSNGDSIRQSSETVPIGSSGNLTAGAVYRFFAVVTPPSVVNSGSQSTITVSARSAFDTLLTRNIACTASVQSPNSTFSLSPTTATRTSLPDTTVFFPVSLVNSGSSSQSFMLTALSSKGWSVALYADTNGDGVRQNTEGTMVTGTITVAAGSQYRFFAATAIPRTVTVGTQAVMNVVAKLASDPSVMQSGSYTAIAGQRAGCSISPTGTAVNAPPGQKAYIPFTLTNTGVGEDTFTLSTYANLGWICRVVADNNQDGIHQSTEITAITSIPSLAASTQKRAFVEVAVPGGLTQSVSSTISLRATSSTETSATTSVAYTVAAQTLVTGDINNDGQLTSSDAADAARIAVGEGTWTPAQKTAADVNRDGTVNVRDVLQMLNMTRSSPLMTVASLLGGRTVSIPALTTAPDATTALNVVIDNGTGVAGFQCQIALDSNVIGILDAIPGTLMNNDPNWQVSFNTGEGWLRIIAYNTAGSSLTDGAGILVQLPSIISPYVSVGTSTAVGWDGAIVSDASGTPLAPLNYNGGIISIR